MKTHALLLGSALALLTACSQMGSHSYGSNNYPGQSRDMAMSDSERDQWKEEKLEAMVNHFFDKADANHSGSISHKEFDRSLEKHFAEADTNHDGKLSRDEVMAMKRKEMKEMHNEMHAMRETDENQQMSSGDSREISGGNIRAEASPSAGSGNYRSY